MASKRISSFKNIKASISEKNNKKRYKIQRVRKQKKKRIIVQFFTTQSLAYIAISQLCLNAHSHVRSVCACIMSVYGLCCDQSVMSKYVQPCTQCMCAFYVWLEFACTRT